MNNPNEIREATHMDKRVESMEDGRYIIYFTFPNMEKDVKKFSTNKSEEKKQ